MDAVAPMQNLLPLDQDEVINTLLPLPEDENEWQNHQLMFATRSGNVRRNLMSDFGNVMSNGKIAMKLDEATPSSTSASAQAKMMCC